MRAWLRRSALIAAVALSGTDLIEPIVVEIQTVPPLEGIRFALDGRPFESNAEGVASIGVYRGGTHQLEALLLESNTDQRRVEFARWGDAVFIPRRLIVLSDSISMEAGLDVLLPVELQFVDRIGEPVAAERVSEVVLRSSIGDVYAFSGEAKQWLQAGHVVGREGFLEEVPIVYAVQSVTIDGSNVVNRGQQRFTVRPDQPPELDLLLYSVQVSGQDALFGFPIGSGVRLQYPDGRRATVPFESDSQLRLTSLARGTYRASVVGAVGIAPPSVFVLSRDQQVNAIMISALDLLVVFLIGIFGLSGLFLIGRPKLRARLAKRLFTVGLLALTAGPWTATAELLPPEQADPIPLLAYYYIWFDPGSWERAKSDLPLLGKYSSDEVEVMRQHVAWAKQVGIDGFIVSWKSTDPLNRRLAQLIEVAEAEDFKLTIIYQGLDFERRPLPIDRIAADLEYFLATYADRAAFNLYGHPVVIWSGTWEFSPEQIATVTEQIGDRLLMLASERQVETYEAVADLVDGNAYYWSSVDPDEFPGYQEKLDGMSQAVHARGGLWIAPAAPGFDATLLEGTRVVERKDGETLLQELSVAYASAPDAVGLISWNEFSENSHVEPSENYGMRYLEVLSEFNGVGAPEVVTFDSNEPAGTILEPNLGRTGSLLLLGALGLASLLVIIRRGISARRSG